ncbi:GntR family transcriptional regulator [Nocardia sp. R7R-8]|uniref:GntR family transcriptional regulator n=1 Tax=Nocardia sp. R7R-8 TaxID=3459304 RepID=UPI00403DCC68
MYDEVKEGILTGTYAPGSWLSIDELGRRFEVSRQPVMEAMRRLSTEWLVEIVPQVGCRVASYDRQPLEDYFATFSELEAHVAELAAKRRTQSQMDKLEEVLGRFEQETRSNERRALIREAHDTILEMAHSLILAQLCEQMWDFGEYVWTTLSHSDQEYEEALSEWLATLRRLTQAISNQNASLARLHMVVWITGTSPSA